MVLYFFGESGMSVPLHTSAASCSLGGHSGGCLLRLITCATWYFRVYTLVSVFFQGGGGRF